jgi:hypothetical protein
LLHTIEAQRRDLPFGLEAHFVGGFAQVTTVTPTSIQQRILTRWDDKTGEPITPGPIDWAKWREQHGVSTKQPALPAGLSRLKRQMLEKKAAKSKLRSAA